MTEWPAALDWSDVVKRYEHGADIAPIPGASTLAITGADEEKVYVKHRLWKDALSRPNLEKAVRLLGEGRMTRKSGDFVDQYRTFVADERPTTAATVLKDLGFLE
ncbi:MAG TPA: hypothetical protein VGD11_02905 [Mycobacteriales bacterium]|jgi:hypothetical protein